MFHDSCLGIWWCHDIWISENLKFDYLKNKKSFQSEIKTFLPVSQVLSFRHTKQISKNVDDTTFKVDDSESIRKILEKHLQRNLHFRKLFCIYEQNFWNTPVKEYFFSVYHTLGYIYDCSQCTTLKMFNISFSKSPSRKSVIIHHVYNEDKIIYFLYIFILIYIYIFMWILNTCVFVSASEIGALILYFTKLILRIQKTGKHCKYFCLLYKNFMSKQTSPPFLNNPPL